MFSKPSVVSLLFAALLVIGPRLAHAAQPVNFLFMDSDELASHVGLIDRADIEGVQIVYNWKALETAPDQYDFARIRADLAFLEKRGKKLFAQVQDRVWRRRQTIPARISPPDPAGWPSNGTRRCRKDSRLCCQPWRANSTGVFTA